MQRLQASPVVFFWIGKDRGPKRKVRRMGCLEVRVDWFTVSRQSGTRLHSAGLSTESLTDYAADADLLMNPMPVGVRPAIRGSIWPEGNSVPSHLTVFDLVYNLHRTRLLEQAASCEARDISGLEMLLQQGARLFSIWTNRQALIETMRQRRMV